MCNNTYYYIMLLFYFMCTDNILYRVVHIRLTRLTHLAASHLLREMPDRLYTYYLTSLL